MTLQEAAEQLGVHYMTVYRYVRLGRLPAHKSGGMWQVNPTDLEGLRRGHDRSVRPRRSADWEKRLEARMLEGDEAGAWGVVEAALASGSDPAGIYTDVLGPALASLAKRGSDGDIQAGQELVAAPVALRLIGRLGPRFARRGRSKGTVVVTTPPGESQVAPSLMLSDLLRGVGFDVIDLGADVPVEALAEVLSGADGVVAACISSTRANADRAVRRALRTIRKAAPGIPVFVGGPSVPDAAAAEVLGADGWAAAGPAAVEMVLVAAR